MNIEHVFDVLRKEWPIIRQAPFLFIGAVVLVSSTICGCVIWLVKANLDRKDDLIKTLQAQLSLGNTTKDFRQATDPAKEPPNFRLSLMGANIFIAEKPKLTGISLDVIVINTGSSSVAMDWQLSVIPRTGAPKQAQLTKMPPSLVARGIENTAHLNAAEDIQQSTLNDPLQTDLPRQGKLLFYISMPKEDVLSSVLELSVKDAKGRPFMVRQDVKQWLSR